MVVRTSWAQNFGYPLHAIQSLLHRFLTSEVHATEVPAPWRQRASTGSPRSDTRITSAVGLGLVVT